MHVFLCEVTFYEQESLMEIMDLSRDGYQLLIAIKVMQNVHY